MGHADRYDDFRMCYATRHLGVLLLALLTYPVAAFGVRSLRAPYSALIPPTAVGASLFP